MLSIAVKDILFKSLDSSNKNHIETMYRDLSEMYKNKHESFMRSQQKISNLSEKLRQSSKKYRKLELSISQSAVQQTKLKDNHQAEINKLQSIISDLKGKNTDLEQRILDMSELIHTCVTSDDPKQKKSLSEIDFTGNTKKEESAFEIELPDNPVNDNTVLLNFESDDQEYDEDEVTLEFSPSFKAVLEKHAQLCNN